MTLQQLHETTARLLSEGTPPETPVVVGLLDNFDNTAYYEVTALEGPATSGYYNTDLEYRNRLALEITHP